MFLIPIFNILFNIFFIGIFEFMISCFLPSGLLSFNHLIRTLILYMIIIFGMYTGFGQRCVAFFARGRNTIGREEKILQPIIEQLKDRTDIRGYSAPVKVQFMILEALNNISGKKIKRLNKRVNRMKYEYFTGTVKIFTFDSLDIETNSYGNSIFISKGALDTLPTNELRAVIYNEFAQIKTNVILSPFALTVGIFSSAIFTSFSGSYGSNFADIFGNIGAIITYSLFCIIRLVLWFITKKYTNTAYMLFERKIFIKADRATHKAGFSSDLLSYLEKLYVFKLGDKEVSSLFVELRPLVAYRINYFDNVLGKNKELSVDNYAWSSNYMERVQTVNNNKNIS